MDSFAVLWFPCVVFDFAGKTYWSIGSLQRVQQSLLERNQLRYGFLCRLWPVSRLAPVSIELLETLYETVHWSCWRHCSILVLEKDFLKSTLIFMFSTSNKTYHQPIWPQFSRWPFLYHRVTLLVRSEQECPVWWNQPFPVDHFPKNKWSSRLTRLR